MIFFSFDVLLVSYAVSSRQPNLEQYKHQQQKCKRHTGTMEHVKLRNAAYQSFTSTVNKPSFANFCGQK